MTQDQLAAFDKYLFGPSELAWELRGEILLSMARDLLDEVRRLKEQAGPGGGRITDQLGGRMVNMEASPRKFINERDFRSTVIGMARAFGWHSYHPWISIHSEAGFPDLVLVRNGQLIFAELKTEVGKTTEAQQKWLEQLTLCEGAEVYLWRPSMLDKIEEVLR